LVRRAVLAVLVAVAIGATSLVPGLARPLPAGNFGGSRLRAQLSPGPASFPISHFVFLVMENHAYDNYFASYCRALGPYCDFTTLGPNLSACIPLSPSQPSKGCHSLFRFPGTAFPGELDLDHGYGASHSAVNGGLMNNFYAAEHDQNQTFGYYDGSLIPTYWDYAEQFGLGDDFFSGTLSYSLPNHWSLVGATPPAVSENTVLVKNANAPLTGPEKTYLGEANRTASIVDLLEPSSVSWKYYDWSPVTYSKALAEPNSADTPGSAFSFWNPLMAKNESYRPAFAAHFVNRDDFFNDSRNGTLPNVSWVIPSLPESDHPPVNLTAGESFVAQVLNAATTSPEWRSTAVFVTWDEYGGYYDHLAPPAANASSVAIRVPLLVVSPYTPQGYVSSSFGYFESFLRMVEWRFGLPSLSSQDARAPLLLNFFDTSAAPRPPFTEPTSPSALSYPQTFAPLRPPAGATGFDAVASGSLAYLNWTAAPGGAPRAGWLLSYGPPSNPSAVRVRLDHTVLDWTASNLTPGASYVFTLRSFDGPSVSAAVTAAIGPSAIHRAMTYPIAFNESGLPAGTTWWVTLNGTNKSGRGPTIVFTEPNGTYPFRAGATGQFAPVRASGLLTADGGSPPQWIGFRPVSRNPFASIGSTFLGMARMPGYALFFALIGANIAVPMIFLVLIWPRRVATP
jgi:phospholipase C